MGPGLGTLAYVGESKAVAGFERCLMVLWGGEGYWEGFAWVRAWDEVDAMGWVLSSGCRMDIGFRVVVLVLFLGIQFFELVLTKTTYIYF